MAAQNPSPASDGASFERALVPSAPPAARNSWFTPREVAAQRRIRVSKIMTWIHTGELEAVNLASDTLRSPRWKISTEALARFDSARSNRLLITGAVRRVRVTPGGRKIPVKEFFD